MKPTVVIGYPGFGDIEIEQEILRTIDAEVIHVGATDTPAAREAVRGADAVMVTIQPVPADLIASMERCRIIARVGTGLDAIDLDAATQHGVWVTYVPDYSIDEVSTHTITLLLAQARGLAPLLRATQAGKWDSSGVYVRRLQGQVLGLVGCGRIGLATAAKGRGLGLEVIAYDPYANADALAAAGVRGGGPAHPPARLRLYLPAHAADPRQPPHHQRCGAGADEAQRLSDQHGARPADRRSGAPGGGAGRRRSPAPRSDVLSVEPPAADNPLLHEPRILITPHVAWYSEAAKVDVRRRGAEEVVRVLRNEAPRAPVNRVEAR